MCSSSMVPGFVRNTSIIAKKRWGEEHYSARGTKRRVVDENGNVLFEERMRKKEFEAFRKQDHRSLLSSGGSGGGTLLTE